MYTKKQASLEMIVLYDGICLFCEGWVNFVIDRTQKTSNIQFTPLEFVTLSTEIQSRLNQSGNNDSIVCISSDNKIHLKSDASLIVMRQLTAPYNTIAMVLQLIPRRFRNGVYDFIGKYRYKIWGKKNVCELPDGEKKKHFIATSGQLTDKLAKIHRDYFVFNRDQ